MSAPSYSLPARSQATHLWLLAIGLGSLTIMGYIGVRSGANNFPALMGVTFTIAIFSAVFSSPVLLLLPLISRWALKAPTLVSRRLRLALAVSSLFGAAAVSAYLVARGLDAGPNNVNVLWFAAPYLPAALLAAAYVYRPWLFRP